MDRLTQAFLTEAREHVATLEGFVLRLDSGSVSADEVHRAFRSAHTIKGAAATMELADIASVAHATETLLNQLREGKRTPDRRLADTLLQALDAIGVALDALEQDKPLPDLSLVRRSLEDTAQSPTGTLAASSTMAGGAGPRSATIRVGGRAVEALVDAVGELIVHKSRLASAAQEGNRENLEEAVARLDRLSADLYRAVLDVRMMPVGTVYERFPRAVRDLAREQGKEVNLLLVGAEVQLDKSLIESLGDPLLHMIRNAVDHGIEPSSDRVRAGKDATGEVRVETRLEADRVFVEVADDGRGLDPSRLRSVAVDKGILRAEEAERLDLNETYLLVCRPGFSTAKAVTSTSGRGVGMDVVKTWVESVGGSLRVDSELGRGTRFTLQLPQSVAIVKAFVLRVGAERFLLPADAVVAASRLSASALHEESGRESITFDGVSLPLLRVSRFFAVPEAGTAEVVLVVERHGRRAALAVDGVEGRQEIVVKHPEHAAWLHPGVGGASILGDGRVALVLHVGGLLEGLSTAALRRPS